MRQETEEMEFMRLQTTGGQSGDERARPWHRLDPKARSNGCLHHSLTRITNAGCPRISHQCHLLAASQALEKFLTAFGFIEFEIAQQRLGNIKVFQQLAQAP